MRSGGCPAVLAREREPVVVFPPLALVPPLLQLWPFFAFVVGVELSLCFFSNLYCFPPFLWSLLPLMALCIWLFESWYFCEAWSYDSLLRWMSTDCNGQHQLVGGYGIDKSLQLFLMCFTLYDKLYFWGVKLTYIHFWDSSFHLDNVQYVHFT